MQCEPRRGVSTAFASLSFGAFQKKDGKAPPPRWHRREDDRSALSGKKRFVPQRPQRTQRWGRRNDGDGDAGDSFL